MIEVQSIRDFLNARAGKTLSFGDEDSLIATQIIDSLGMAELIVFLETTCNTEFDAEELIPENLENLNAIIRFLKRKEASEAG